MKKDEAINKLKNIYIDANKRYRNKPYGEFIFLTIEDAKSIANLISKCCEESQMPKCKKNTSKSKRKNISCEGCPYLKKTVYFGISRWRCTY